MTSEEAQKYADGMTYRDAIFNLLKARCIPYRKATFIKVHELLKKLEQNPSDTVSRGVFEQVMWERDIAIEQLKELGYGLGEKIEPTISNDQKKDSWDIDEAIKSAEYEAEEYSEHNVSNRDEMVSELRQIAEWLKELKTSRKCIERIRIACLELRGEGLEDEVVEAMNEYLYDMGKEWEDDA